MPQTDTTRNVAEVKFRIDPQARAAADQIAREISMWTKQ